MDLYIREYGAEHEKTLLFFPGSCEPWEEHAYAAEKLAARYRVLQVVPDGEDPDEHTDFISVEKTVADTAAWLRAHDIAGLDALYGLSYGGGMAVRFLAASGIPVKKAIIDAGTAPYAYPRWVCYLICVKDFLTIKLGQRSLSVMKAAFPPERFARNPERWKEEYRALRDYLRAYSNRTVWNIFWSANNYAVPHPAPKLDTQIQFWVGTEEWGSRFRDLEWARNYLPQIEVVKIPGMMHGELVMMHPEEFAEMAFAFLEGEA